MQATLTCVVDANADVFGTWDTTSTGILVSHSVGVNTTYLAAGFTGLSIPYGASITSASITLTRAITAGSSIDVSAAMEQNISPSFPVSAADLAGRTYFNSLSVSSGTGAAGTTVTITCTSTLQSVVNLLSSGQTLNNLLLVIAPQTESTHTFASFENGTYAAAQITYSFPLTVSETGTGGVGVGGSALVSSIESRLVSGGIVSGGAGGVFRLLSDVGSAGGSLGGSADEFLTFVDDGMGGIIGGGVVDATMVHNPFVGGGCLLGGDADQSVVYAILDGSGGVLAGGTVPQTYDESMTGGSGLGGSARNTIRAKETGSGGILIGGDSFPIVLISVLGGCRVGGTAAIDSNQSFFPIGGVVAGGQVPTEETETVVIKGRPVEVFNIPILVKVDIGSSQLTAVQNGLRRGITVIHTEGSTTWARVNVDLLTVDSELILTGSQ